MSLFFKNREGQTPVDQNLINDLKLSHIQDMTELYEQERENIALGINWLNKSKNDIFDYLSWIELHKHMYSNVWKFAGIIRKTELQNPDFHMPYDIRPSLKTLSEDLKIWCEHQTYNQKELAAILHERLLTIHPFKDGNGRWARVLTEHICKQLNYKIPNWGVNISNDEHRRNLYIEAVKNARKNGVYDKLIKIMFYE